MLPLLLETKGHDRCLINEAYYCALVTVMFFEMHFVNHHLSCVQVRHKPGSTATEDGYGHEIRDLGRRGMIVIMYVAKTKEQRLLCI